MLIHNIPIILLHSFSCCSILNLNLALGSILA